MRWIERLALFLLSVVVVLDHVRTARAAPDDRAYAANEFTLRSDKGDSIASFRISKEGLPELVLADGTGKGRAVVAVRANGDSILALTEPNGTVRAGFLGNAKGEYQMQIADDKAVPRVVAMCDTGGHPALLLESARGTPLVTIEVTDLNEPLLRVTNEKKDGRLEYGALPDGLLRLYLFDSGTAPRVGLEIDPAGAAHVFAQDRAGKARGEFEALSEGPPGLSLKDKAGKKVPLPR